MLRIIIFFLLSTTYAHAITLMQTKPGDILFDLTPLAPADAGAYFNDSYTRDTTLLTIDGIPDDVNWKVYARISAEVPGISVKIKRIGDGTGSTSLEGSGIYRNLGINYTTTAVFSGQGKRFNIPMQTQIKGIGVSDKNGTFNTEIEYKVETE